MRNFKDLIRAWIKTFVLEEFETMTVGNTRCVLAMRLVDGSPLGQVVERKDGRVRGELDAADMLSMLTCSNSIEKKVLYRICDMMCQGEYDYETHYIVEQSSIISHTKW